MKTTIKKFSAIMVLFVAISFFGCEQEEEQEMFDKVEDSIEKVYSEDKDKIVKPGN